MFKKKIRTPESLQEMYSEVTKDFIENGKPEAKVVRFIVFGLFVLQVNQEVYEMIEIKVDDDFKAFKMKVDGDKLIGKVKTSNGEVEVFTTISYLQGYAESGVLSIVDYEDV